MAYNTNRLLTVGHAKIIHANTQNQIDNLKSAVVEKTITWNQLFKPAQDWAMNWGTGVVTKGTDEISIENPTTRYYAFGGYTGQIVPNHKYLYICYAKATNATAGIYLRTTDNAIEATTRSSEYEVLHLIQTATITGYSFDYRATMLCTENNNNGTIAFKHPKLFDLTMMGIEDITFEEFIRIFPNWENAVTDTEGTQKYIPKTANLEIEVDILNNNVNDIYTSGMAWESIAFETTNTSVILYGGGTGTYGNWYSSDFISIDGYKRINVVAWCYYQSGVDICPVSFFDNNYTYIGGVSGNEGTVVSGSNRIYNGMIEIPKNAKYIKISAYKGSGSDGYKTSLSAYKYVGENKFSNLNIVCIGDSLTEGDMGADPYASTQNITQYNYPYWLQKYLFCSVTNKGKSGYTTIQAWQNVVQSIDFTNVNTIIIMLGSNGGLTDTIDTDCPDGQPYTNYANTNTGCYCKIVEYCIAQTEGAAQIVLCTPPHVGKIRGEKRTTTIEAAEVVRKIAIRYSLPLIDMMLEGGFSDFNESVFQPVDGLHFNPEGYKRMGTFIGSRITAINAIQIN